MERKTFAQRSFCVAAPTQWNGLSLNIKQASTVDQFKSLLKTHLFINLFLLFVFASEKIFIYL